MAYQLHTFTVAYTAKTGYSNVYFITFSLFVVNLVL